MQQGKDGIRVAEGLSGMEPSLLGVQVLNGFPGANYAVQGS